MHTRTPAETPPSADTPVENSWGRVEHLTDLLDRISRAIDDAEVNELAPLSREKRLVLAELDSLAGTVKGSTVDRLAEQRDRRRAAAAVVLPAAVGGVQRGKRSG
jgi:hypothetical protein